MWKKYLNKLVSVVLVLTVLITFAFGCMLNVSAEYNGTYSFSGGIANYEAKQASVDLTINLTEGFAAGDFAVVNFQITENQSTFKSFSNLTVNVKGGTTKDGSVFDASNVVVKFTPDISDEYLGYITFWTNELKYYTSLTFELTYTMTNSVQHGGTKYNVDITKLDIATKFSEIEPTFIGDAGYIHSHYYNDDYDTDCNVCGAVRDVNVNKWVQTNGVWYYYDNFAKPVTGWLNLGVWYYFDNTGIMQTGWQNINGIWYYFESSGAMITNWRQIDGVWYYFADSGAMITTWAFIDGYWYYFNTSGAMVTGWQQIDGTWYYFNDSGEMLTNWANIYGSWYYFANSGAMVTDWMYINGYWYYFNTSGAMVTDWQIINGNWYYFYADGSMASNCWIGNYWLTESGAMS